MWVRRQNLKEIKESERGSPVRDGLHSWHRVAAFYCFDIAGLPSLIKLYKRKATLVLKPNEKNEMTKASLLLSQTGTKSHGHAALIHDAPMLPLPLQQVFISFFPQSLRHKTRAGVHSSDFSRYIQFCLNRIWNAALTRKLGALMCFTSSHLFET